MKCVAIVTVGRIRKVFPVTMPIGYLDSTGRLLTAVSAPQSNDAEKLKMELLRVRFDEQTRGERRKKAGAAIETRATDTLKPWREVIMPHEDVASGRLPAGGICCRFSGRYIWEKG